MVVKNIDLIVLEEEKISKIKTIHVELFFII